MNIHTSAFSINSSLYSYSNTFSFNDQPEQPLTKGHLAPAFSIPASAGLWATQWANNASIGKVQLPELLSHRPLVISFYSPHWSRYGHQHIQSLVELYEGVKALGGEMLVLTAEPIIEIYRLAKQYPLPFSIAQDANNLIAYQFGVYSLKNPVWQRIAGITADVAVPATFVVAQDGYITAAFVDHNFQEALPARSVLSAVYAARNKRIKKVA
jgi:peroxiredoxin